nr:hypothetical protein [Candidatus Woesearchaeota archaeon]
MIKNLETKFPEIISVKEIKELKMKLIGDNLAFLKINGTIGKYRYFAKKNGDKLYELTEIKTFAEMDPVTKLEIEDYKEGGYFYNHDDLMKNESFKNCRENGHKFGSHLYINNGLSVRWCEIDKIYWLKQSSHGPVIEVEQ